MMDQFVILNLRGSRILYLVTPLQPTFCSYQGSNILTEMVRL